MKESVEALDDFINDFNLKTTNGTTVFNAVIHIVMKGRLQLQNSEVQIITSDGIFAIYLLNMDSGTTQVSDMYEAGKNLFRYTKRKCLKINGKAGENDFVISIFPEDK
ncbi:MAG: hypothetical protein ABJA37_11130 [Ferruginibacter sp.]